ncbi:MAG: hypothetical protein AB1483_01005 [Candidatus Zixiibacteriota bacterium]
MRIKLLCCLMVLLLAVPLAARPPKGLDTEPSSAIIDNTTFIDANRILMFVTNHGNFGRDLAGVFGYDYGTWFPYAGDTALIAGNIGKAGDFSPNYAAGLWVGGLVNDTIRVVVSVYSSEYTPGPMVDSTYSPDSPDFRVYKLYRDSLAGNPSGDYTNWPVDQGAPVNEDGTPKMIGDQMLWCVYNDAYANNHDNDAGFTDPLGIEVKQTVFSFDRIGSLGNMVFVKYQIYNKGVNTIQDCYFSIWYDPDLGTAGDDLVGCDTTIDLGFVYNSDNDDGQYGAAPPAMGCDFFQGPLVFTGDEADTARMWDTTWVGYTNMGLYSFNKYINGTDPDEAQETFNYMRGFNSDGSPYTYEGEVLKFVHSGDPVTGEGDIDIAPADRRWMQTTGPVTEFAPGDSTEIICAMIVGQGSDNLSSVTVVKNLDKFAQVLYEEGFNPPAPPAKPNVTVARLSGEITLSWDDTSEVDQGEYPFEGYSVWQGETPAGPWKLLGTYDVINEREDAGEPLVDTLFDTESGLDLPVVMRSVKNTGLSYHYTATSDALTNTSLKDLTEYYFKVSAFSFGYFKQNGDAVPNGDRFLESERTLSITPQSPVAGIHPVTESYEVLPVTHSSGISDGVIEPIIMDPLALTGHDYRLTFTHRYDTTYHPWEFADTTFDFNTTTDTCDLAWDTSADPDTAIVTYCVDTIVVEIEEGSGVDTLVDVVTLWHVYDTDANRWVLQDQVNQEGDDDYFVFDGILLKVQGPLPGVKRCDIIDCENDPSSWGWDIPAGTRRFTWAEGDFGFEGFRGALGWESPAHYFNGLSIVGPGELTEVVLRLATVSAEDGTFDPNDENVSYAYRFLRNAQNPPAQPEFAPFIVNPSASYVFQEFDRTCPLSAWNMDTDPPTRLALGYMENNVSLGRVDGKYWPAESDSLVALATDNVGSGGPREWLFIFNQPYSETVNPDWATNALSDPAIPIQYWATWNRRGHDVPFSPGGTGEDEFQIFPGRINLPADTFFFTAPSPQMTSTENDLDLIKPVPNPFYLSGGYDPNPGSYAIKFHHLPAECTITIYNLGGDLIRTIEKNDPSTAEVTWDVLTENRLPVASGIYIYVVDAPGFGQKIGKMAVFVEQEVLDIY